MTRAPQTRLHSFRLCDPDEPGRVLRGRIESPPGAEEDDTRLPFVLILHGFKGFMDWGFFPELSRRIAGAGMIAVRFNVSGSGIGEDLESFTDEEGFAQNTITRELEDVARVRQHVLGGAYPWVDPERAGVVGHSRGGAVALLHAAETGAFRAVVTWAAVDGTDRYGEDVKREWRERGHLLVPNARTGQIHRLDVTLLEDLERNRERLDVRAACGRLSTPTLLVHGRADEAVPFAAAGALEQAFPPAVARVLAVDGAGHTFGAGHPFGGVGPELELVLAETTTWLAERCLRPQPELP